MDPKWSSFLSDRGSDCYISLISYEIPNLPDCVGVGLNEPMQNRALSRRIQVKRLVLIFGEQLLVFGLFCFLLVLLCPEWFFGLGQHLIGPDRLLPNTDLSNTLFMVQRSALGESGCATELFSLPMGSTVCSDVPNPLVTTWMGKLALFVGPARAINGGALCILASNGLAMYAALRLRKVDVAVALVGGAFFCIAPSVSTEIAFGRPVSAWWAPSFFGVFLWLEVLAQRKGWKTGILAVVLMGLGCAVTPIGIVLLFPWALFETCLLFREDKERRQFLVRLTGWSVAAAVCVLPIAMGQAQASSTRLVSEGWWGELLEQGERCVNGAYLPCLHPWNSGRMAPLLGAGSTALSLFLLAFLLMQSDKRTWLAASIAGTLWAVVGLGPCLGGSSPVEFAPIRLLSESIFVLKLIPVWRFWAVAGLLFTFAFCLSFQAFLRREGTVGRWFLWVVVLIHLCWGGGWVRSHLEKNRIDWPVHPTLSFLEKEEVLLDLPLVSESLSVHSEVGEIPVARFNPEPHDWPRWRRVIQVEEYWLLLAADALQRGEDWRVYLRGHQKEHEDGLRRILLHPRKVAFERLAEWRSFLDEIGAEWERSNAEIEVYRLPSSF